MKSFAVSFALISGSYATGGTWNYKLHGEDWFKDGVVGENVKNECSCDVGEGCTQSPVDFSSESIYPVKLASADDYKRVYNNQEKVKV